MRKLYGVGAALNAVLRDPAGVGYGLVESKYGRRDRKVPKRLRAENSMWDNFIQQ